MRLRYLLAFLVSLGAASSAWAQSSVLAYPPPVHPLGYCALSVGAVTAVTLASCSGGIPSGASIVSITVEAQNIRIRDDGVSPTASVGTPIFQGQNVPYSGNVLSQLSFIAEAGTAAVNLLFYSR